MNILGLITLPDWLLLIILGFATLYIYATWNYGYFDKLGLKTDPPMLFFGNMLSRYANKHLHLEDQKGYYNLGRMHGIYEGRKPVLFAGEPDIIKEILVKKFPNFINRRVIKLDSKSKIVEKFLSLMQDEEWRVTRHLLSPTFTSGKLKQMGHLMEECATDGTENTSSKLKQNKSNIIDMKAEMSMYAMNVIASCSFGLQTKCKSMDDPLYVHSKAVFDVDLSWKLALLLMAPGIARQFEIEIFPHSSLQYLKGVTKDVMDRRKKEGIRRPDFLQLLLDAQLEEEKARQTNENKISNGQNKPVLDEMCLISQAILFLTAGFETVSTTASFAFHSLAKNPQCYEKLLEEIKDTKEKNQGKLSTEDIMKMPYLDMVLSETLRMYPFATRLERVCTSDVMLGNIPVKKGMITAIPVYALHHDEKYYPNPETFNPERFSKENIESINQYAYLPFGAGPRNCIGMRFAQMQLKIGLAHYLDKFKFSISPETEDPIEFKLGAAQLTIKNGLKLQLDEIN